MDLRLAQKAALVTGASRGIGRAVAEALVDEGARVCLCARGQGELEQVAAALRARGGQVAVAGADLSTPAGAEQAIAATLDAFGGLDLLVNNVGGSLRAGPFDKATEEQWRRVLDLNLMSAVWCSQRAVAFMRDHGGGAIVNVSSICGREYCTSAPYTAAKAGMVAMTKEMAIDLARYGIRVNSVAPGSILFPGGSWDQRRREKPEMIEKMLRETLPWGRFGAPEEVAAAVVFLLSPRSSWISGACLPVDGAQGRAL